MSDKTKFSESMRKMMIALAKRREGLSGLDLLRETGFSPACIYHDIKILEQKKLIARKCEGTSKITILTEKGRKFLGEYLLIFS